MYDLKFSILIPTYKGAKVIGETLKSILSQSFDNFEIIIHEDASADDIEDIIGLFHDLRIKFFKNEKNLGYAKNLEEARKKATGDIIYLMGQDDILGANALLNTYNAFKLCDDISAVTRPYYWFDKDINVAVRAKMQLNPNKDEIVRITDDFNRIVTVLRTLDQLSGLAYRRKFMNLSFHQNIFPCHAYPFISIFKNHPIVFLKDYNIAVRITSSQTRSVSSIYEKSPIKSWVELFNNIFYEEKFRDFRKKCIKKFVAVNYVGLVQIRNYAKYRYLWREIWYLLKYRWQNIFNLQFWFFSLGCIIMPPLILIPLVDWYKNKINYRRWRTIKFDFQLG